MILDLEAFKENYHQAGKFKDNFQEGIKLLPFSSNPSSAFDKGCGLNGTVGEFFRLWKHDGTKPIEDFTKSAVEPVRKYLDEKNMQEGQIEMFIDMMRDILYVDGNLNICDTSFMKYLPLTPDEETLNKQTVSKYKDGQRKLANYLISMLPPDMENIPAKSGKNLFVDVLSEALRQHVPLENQTIKRDYYILPYIAKSFEKDFKCLMQQNEAVKIKNLKLLLHFYVCYSVTQTLVNVSCKRTEHIDKPEPFYFILSSEKAYVNHDAIIRGWSNYMKRDFLDRLFGRSQALDILNSVLGGNIGFYHEILEALSSTPFEKNMEACNELLSLYQAEKRAVFNRRTSEDSGIDIKDTTVNNYDEFINMLEYLCTGLQSPSYKSRMRKKVIDLLSVRFLQNRKRSGYILVLDNEMLTFLIALFTKSKKTKLEDMYKQFRSYGIYFNRGTRLAIENYLLKLNLLDRKSDSGETQYVKVIL